MTDKQQQNDTVTTHIIRKKKDLTIYVVNDFLMNRTKFVGGNKLLPVIKHGFLRSEENVFPAIFEHPQGVWENVFLYNFQYLCMVDVITIHVGRFYCLEFVNILTLWQMLLPSQMLLPCFVCDFFYLR